MNIVKTMTPKEYVNFRANKNSPMRTEALLSLADDVVGAHILGIMLNVDYEKIISHYTNKDFDRYGEYFVIPEWYWDQLKVSQKQLRAWRTKFKKNGLIDETRKGRNSRLKIRLNYDKIAQLLAEDVEDECAY